MARVYQARQTKNKARRYQHRPWRKWYASARFRTARAGFIRANPLCADCGEVAHNANLDHKVPHRGSPGLFWDVNNWQTLCHDCHSKKTQRGE